MCWSKPSSSDDESISSLSTTTQSPMADGKPDCGKNGVPCDPPKNDFCYNGGICCMFKPDDTSNDYCACEKGYYGSKCQNRMKLPSKEGLEKMRYIAAFSAILGVVIITFFVVLVVLQVKYYRRRKKRALLEDGGANRVSSRDTGHNEKEEKKRLTIQPGYSWRQSVRGHSKRLIGVSCKSEPDDLSTVGLKCDFIAGGESGKQINLCQIRDVPRDGKDLKRGFSEGTGGVCFSRNLSIGQKQGTEVSGQSKRQETGVSGDKDRLIQ